MDIEDIKVGETYLLPVTVSAIEKDGWSYVASYSDYVYKLAPEEVETLLQTGIKNTPTAPKYDPCRMFRKGDIVTPKERNGRIPWGKDSKLVVVADERMAGVTVRDEETGEEHFICALFLELVTPVEELEPYHLNEIYDIDDGKLIGYEVARGDTRDSIFYGGENHLRTIAQAKAAAETECKRLNEEYIKEKNNA